MMGGRGRLAGRALALALLSLLLLLVPAVLADEYDHRVRRPPPSPSPPPLSSPVQRPPSPSFAAGTVRGGMAAR